MKIMENTARAARAIVRRPGSGVTIDPARLTLLRESRKLSRAALAALIRPPVTSDALTKIENGLRRPSMDLFGRLCTALDCQPADLKPDLAPQPRMQRQPCDDCGALYGHEPGCPQAT